MLLVRRRAALALPVAAGLLQALAIAAPWNGQPQWWLQILSLALFAHGVDRRRTPRSAGMHGWLFGVAWLTGTFWWLFISMHVYGGLASPLAAAAVFLLAGFLALYYGLAAALSRKLQAGHIVLDSLLFASLWLAAELARGTLFTGFPWGAGGYAHVDGPLTFLARWVGVYGIGFVAAALAFAIARLASGMARRTRSHWIGVAAVALLLLTCNAASSLLPRDPAGPRMTVELLQGNIPQDEKFEPGTGVPIALRWYAESLQQSRASLVVAPETAIPLLPRDLPEGYLAAIARRFGGEQAALIGAPLGSLRDGYTNSVLGFKPQAAVYRYDKHHLVPFGEFIPPLFKWFTRMMNIPLGDFNRGSVGQESLEWRGERLAPNVCYEDLFGEELGARFRDPSRAPTIFVNVSNIGWFGNSIAIDQHLAASRMRALEFELPMLRATNTGATAVIDRQGRVTHQLARHTRGVLTADVQGGRGITPFAWWVSRMGLWPLVILAVAAPVGVWLRSRRLRDAPAAPDAPR